MKYLPFALNVLSAIAALVAAVLWWLASVRVVHPDHEVKAAPGEFMTYLGSRGPIAVNKRGVALDLVPTLALQSRLNSFAATAAALAALFQGINALLPTPSTT